MRIEFCLSTAVFSSAVGFFSGSGHGTGLGLAGGEARAIQP